MIVNYLYKRTCMYTVCEHVRITSTTIKFVKYIKCRHVTLPNMITAAFSLLNLCACTYMSDKFHFHANQFLYK